MQITLLDGVHELSPPTFYALQLMDEYGADLSDFSPKKLPAMLAAFLTDSEPFADGKPAKVWTPVMAAKVIDPMKLSEIVEAIAELLDEAFPDSKGGDEARPTPAQSGSTSE